MTDRELLELAAKAAGIRYIKPTVDYSGALGLALCDEHGRIGQDWSPLVDNGDALRLAVKLCMQVECSKGYQHVSVYGRDGTFSEQHDGIDPYAATRRAIVRAAAEIGKAMP